MIAYIFGVRELTWTGTRLGRAVLLSNVSKHNFSRLMFYRADMTSTKLNHTTEYDQDLIERAVMEAEYNHRIPWPGRSWSC